jgi:hypothetical protein
MAKFLLAECNRDVELQAADESATRCCLHMKEADLEIDGFVNLRMTPSDHLNVDQYSQRL